MAYSNEMSRQRYSSELVAYTLLQFSAARALLDQHQAAADKLPASHSYDYRTPKPRKDEQAPEKDSSSATSSSTSSPQSGDASALPC
ncbi:hypothetical protein Hypma_007511 [Hypsizygus marmoreus]|uniref:Uncharacterized protein n=1 Tax=Hypsizygus marmoreus TaxID=39966 RepID=A0A369K1A5_HYPMA|nr:hypothetical protein Hypma_007511 [Hypsizygus marmoreus]